MTAPIDGIPEAIRRDQTPPLVQGVRWNLGAWVDSKELMCPHCYSPLLKASMAGGLLFRREHLRGVTPVTTYCELCGHSWNISQRNVADYLHYVLCGKDPDPFFDHLRVIARYYSENHG